MLYRNDYFPVLDHGFVALKDMMGSDQDIEEMARVSYQAGTRQRSDTRTLLRYLMRHRHTSPFERVEFVFHVGLPIFVARQWIRHRTASVNEYSGRYSIMPMIFYTPEQDRVQTQSTTNKQGSSDDLLPDEQYQYYLEGVGLVRDRMKGHYEDNLEADMARELARIDLPLSMYTYWYWKIDLHNLFHFLSLRLDPHAQKEMQMYSHVIAQIVKENVPLSWEAFYDYHLNGVTFSRMERKLLYYGTINAFDFHHGPDIDDMNKAATQYGMTDRERREFWLKMVDPHMELDPLPKPYTAQYFMNKIEAAAS